MGGGIKLRPDQPVFIGFKMDNALARQLQALTGSDRKYVSEESSEYLRICTLGEERWVGKLIHERLTTERVDDVRRNVLSILGRLCPETRLPQQFEILPCEAEEGGRPGSADETRERQW